MANTYLCLSCDTEDGPENPEKAKSSDAERPRPWREVLCNELHDQFKVMSNPKFLESGYNRRNYWHVTLPLLATARLAIVDRFGNFELNYCVVLIDVVFFVAFLFCRHLPPRSLWSDAAIMLCCAGYSSAWCLLVDSHLLGSDLVVALLLFGAGAHSFSILGYGSIMAVFRFFLFRHVSGMLGAPAIVMVTFMAWYTNVQEAKVWSQQVAEYEALEKLVDRSSIGFCRIDPLNAVIQTASPRLQSTLCDEQLVHTSLIRFIPGICDALAENLGKSTNAEVVSPFLVTCHVPNDPAGASTFDVRVIPAVHSQSSVSLGLHAVGEKRFDSKVSMQSNSQALLTDSLFDYTISDASFRSKARVPAVAVAASRSAVQSGNLMDAAVQTDPVSFGGLSQRPPRLPAITPATPVAKSGNSRDRSPGGGRSRRRSRRSRTASSDEDLGAVLSAYPPTSTETCMRSILCLIKFMNLPRSDVFCCPWHSTFDVLGKLLETSKSERCDPLWSPNVDWQCRACSGMNSEFGNECGLCQAPKPIQDASQATEQSDSAQAASSSPDQAG